MSSLWMKSIVIQRLQTRKLTKVVTVLSRNTDHLWIPAPAWTACTKNEKSLCFPLEKWVEQYMYLLNMFVSKSKMILGCWDSIYITSLMGVEYDHDCIAFEEIFAFFKYVIDRLCLGAKLCSGLEQMSDVVGPDTIYPVKESVLMMPLPVPQLWTSPIFHTAGILFWHLRQNQTTSGSLQGWKFKKSGTSMMRKIMHWKTNQIRVTIRRSQLSGLCRC